MSEYQEPIQNMLQMEQPSMCQLRIYTLKSRAALLDFKRIWIERHPNSLAKHRIGVLGLWTALENDQLFALVGAESGDVEERGTTYMSSVDFQEDMQGFDLTQIIGLSTILLKPISTTRFPHERR